MNYQLFAHPDPSVPGDPLQPRLTWTVPDPNLSLVVSRQVNFPDPGQYLTRLKLSGYTSVPAGTVFALHQCSLSRGETVFTEMVRSNNSPQIHGLAEYTFSVVDEECIFETTLDFENLLDSELGYYASATTAGVTRYSINVLLLGGDH